MIYIPSTMMLYIMSITMILHIIYISLFMVIYYHTNTSPWWLQLRLGMSPALALQRGGSTELWVSSVSQKRHD